GKHRSDRRRAAAGPPFGPSGGQVVFSVAWVTNTRSPQTTGVELPASGRGAFHRTFSLGDHFSGRSRSAEWPCPSGPRHPGQLSAKASDAKPARVPRTDRIRNMSRPSTGWAGVGSAPSKLRAGWGGLGAIVPNGRALGHPEVGHPAPPPRRPP